MKKLILILVLLLPTLLVAQQDSTSQHFKTSKCTLTIAGKYHGKDTVPLADLQSNYLIKLDCGELVGFEITFPVNGVYITKYTSGNFQMSDLYKQNDNYWLISVGNIQYKTSTGQIHTMKEATIRVKNK